MNHLVLESCQFPQPHLWDPAPFISSVTGHPMLTRKMNEKKKAPPELAHYDVAFAVKPGWTPNPVGRCLYQRRPRRSAQCVVYKAVKRCRRWERVGKWRTSPQATSSQAASHFKTQTCVQAWGTSSGEFASSKHGYRTLTYVLRSWRRKR